MSLLFLLLSLIAFPATADTLNTLKPGHPRLLAHTEDFERVSKLVKTDPLAKRWYGELKQRAEAMLDEPVAVYELRDARRLLYVSNEVSRRAMVLALLYKLEGDRRYIDRIWADLESAAGFEHWNPDHFLDVAVMASAFAIAYDWLYDDWTDAQRNTIRLAIIKHAITPGLRAYDTKTWWTRTKINWNQVCNGGLIMASLAIADEQPELAKRMIDQAVASLPISMKRYAPDGGYDEGPGYWGFGTMYNVLAIASLQSALGTDFGLGEQPGFDVTGGFPVQATGPSGKAFNFGDGKPKTPKSPTMFYFAKRYDQPGYARFAAEHNRGGVLDLLWYDPQVLAKTQKPMPLQTVYESAGVGVLRGAWDDPGAWYVGVKGGAIDHGHAQMDLGSFILESQGIRWLIDLGPDDYNLPGYFLSDAPRWRYYRNRAEGHNTLVINPDIQGGQLRNANALITLKDRTLTAAISSAYDGEVHRHIKLDQQHDLVRMVDQIDLEAASEVWWFAHTKAKAELADDARSALLTQDGKTLRVTLVSPAKATFQVMDASPLPGSPDPEGQNPNDGATIVNPSPGAHFVIRGQTPRFGKPDPANAVRKLAVRLEAVTTERIEVVFENVQ